MLQKKELTMNTSQRRRKLWDIYGGYHCSLIGTCLRGAELRKLARKKIFNLDAKLDEYQLHSYFVSAAEIRTEQSRALQKILDTKFRRSIITFAKVKSEEELEGLWREQMTLGNISGSYWALMTHPALTRDLESRAYGEIHMLGHEFFAHYQRDKKDKRQLEEQQQQIQDLQRNQAVMRKSIKEYEGQALENRILKEEIEHLRNPVDETNQVNQQDTSRLQALKEMVAELREENAALYGSINELSTERDKIAALLSKAQQQISTLLLDMENIVAEKQER